MSRTVLILIALVAGLAAGLVLRAVGGVGHTIADTLAPLGLLWLNALQMTLVPLVFCLMTVGVASLMGVAGGGRTIGVAVAVFLVLLVAGSIAGGAMASGLLAVWPMHPIGGLGPDAAAHVAAPTLADQIIGLIPLNPVAAAAQAAMIPLIVFAAMFGAAAGRLPEEARALLVGVLKAAGDAMIVIVEAVLKAAPVGIFVLTLEAAERVGAGVASGLAQYVALLSLVLAGGLLFGLLLGSICAGPGRFLGAALPPLAVAASTQSSMACLPSLLEAAEGLGLPEPVTLTVVPMAVTMFRLGNVFGGVSAGLMGAALFGIHPSLAQIGLAVGVGVLTNIGVMGLPGQAVLLAAFGPIFTALGAPIEALTLLIAVFALPDIVTTSCSVAGDLAASTLIGRLTGWRAGPAASGAYASASASG